MIQKLFFGVLAALALSVPARADEGSGGDGIDLCAWYAALDFNQPQDHYSKALTRMCREGRKQDELRELRRIAIDIQMQRFQTARQRSGFGSDLSLSRTGIYLIAHRLGIFSAG